MPFLHKVEGVVVGVAANPQDGWTNEKVSDGDPAIAGYKAAKTARLEAAANRLQVVIDEVAKSPTASAELKALASAEKRQAG